MILDFQPGLDILGALIQIGLAAMTVADWGEAPAGPDMFSPVSIPGFC
jgi:hypothetical protein